MKLNIKFISLTIALVSPILYGSFCSALTNQKLNMFSQNNIMFYDPDECLPGGPSTSSTFAGGTFPGNGFNASDDELARLYRAAVSENSCSPGAIKNELSIMANLAEKNGYSSVGDYVLHGRWFAGHTRDVYNYSSEPVSAEELEIARDIINNGNRTFPPQLVEHDCIGDLIKLEVRGQTYYGTGPYNGCDGTGLEDRSLYIPGETIISNAYESTYLLWLGR